MKVTVINESSSVYNLGAHKIANYCRARGDEVWFAPRADMFGLLCDQAFISTIFTWDIPNTITDIQSLLAAGVKVEVGGPAATVMSDYILKETGVTVHRGLDARFEHVKGRYEAVFTSRGCPRGCEFCIVKEMEGTKIVEYEDYPVPVGRRPFVCDNNPLLTSWGHQEKMVARFKHIRKLDLNSGFDDRIFIQDPEKYYHLYSQLKLLCWRFAYDKPEQRPVIKQVADFLHNKGVSYRDIIVFCLAGFDTTFEQARERLQYLVDIGVSPYPMRYRPLDSLEKNYTPPGWVPGSLEHLFGYYGVAERWRKIPWREYNHEYRPQTTSVDNPGLWS